MNKVKIILTLIIFAGFFSTAHAQDVFIETAAPVLDAAPAVDQSTFASDSMAGVEIDLPIFEEAIIVEDKIEEEPTSTEIKPAPVEGKRKRVQSNESGVIVSAVPVEVTGIECAINATTGISTCPKPIDPCLINDMVGCDPPVEPEVEEEEKEETPPAPLFSFNTLWVPGKVSFSATTAGTLENTPVAPTALSETGPNPAIVGKADGRNILSEEKISTNVPASNTITGLFSGANLPWLGLLVLLVFGILAWRKRNE